jgi:hypothetical protein
MHTMASQFVNTADDDPDCFRSVSFLGYEIFVLLSSEL